ncbi:MAG: fatty acid desaturase [Rhodobacteraceae bacterium]|nr:fatty acid desaturase [Paracoccaceae bacterium]
MVDISETSETPGKARSNVTLPRDWVKVLARYREPSSLRSSVELAISAIPFVALWALAWWSMSISYWLTIGISVLNAGFLVRLFAIQHDCGHGAFFHNRALSDWVGRILGVITLTPYDVWRRTHSVHHSTSGNLDKRGMGDVHTLTVKEFNQLSWLRQLEYRVYRHPVTLFGLGPGFLFFLQNRIPYGLMTSFRYWVSAMGTNLAIAAILLLVLWFGGLAPLLLIFLPSTMIAASAGVWLFYVQHQFEDAHWESGDDWQLHDAALNGSSHYDLPSVLQWFSANIGIHHVHHLYSRIPFYRLTEVLRNHTELATGAKRLTLRESFVCAKLHLWDEEAKKLLSFAQARALSN